MPEVTRVNIKSPVSNAKIRKAKRNGRDVIIVPSVTMPNNIVMNGIMYPEAEIAASFMGLDRTPAPFGHPMVNGKFVSASDPEGINLAYVGAWNENVRRENGRVWLDKVIDVEVAGRSESGKRLLDAINKKKPIHTSTGVYMNLEAAVDQPYKHIARGLIFDHDAILLDEPGAATPEQGVGVFVNSEGNEVEIQVTNSALERAEEEIDWAGTRLVEAIMRHQNIGVWEQVKSAVIGALMPGRETTNKQKEDVNMDKESMDALSAKVNALTEAVSKLVTDLPTAVANSVTNSIAPLTTTITAMQTNAKAAEDAEIADLRAKLLKANVLDEESLAELGVNALRKLAARLPKTATAMGLNGAFTPKAEASAFQLPKGE